MSLTHYDYKPEYPTSSPSYGLVRLGLLYKNYKEKHDGPAAFRGVKLNNRIYKPPKELEIFRGFFALRELKIFDNKF